MAVLAPDYGEIGPGTSVKTEHGKIVVSRTEDVEPALDAIKELRDTPEAHKAAPLGGRYVASIPTIVLEQWCVEAGIQPWETTKLSGLIRRKLNDPDYKKLRVWEGSF